MVKGGLTLLLNHVWWEMHRRPAAVRTNDPDRCKRWTDIPRPPILAGMSHRATEKPKLLARVRRLRGQLDAVERALEADIGCADVLMLVASMRGAINGLT